MAIVLYKEGESWSCTSCKDVWLNSWFLGSYKRGWIIIFVVKKVSWSAVANKVN